jgi:ubiquinone/menaquinone biosynthesis C-methylase UbiE
MLSQDEIKEFYDRFGKKQDVQGFYEDPATHLLVLHGLFGKAESVFEYGIGTGRFAEQLLDKYLPTSCQYLGVDISSTMVKLATNRLSRWTNRCHIQLSSGAKKLPVEDGAYDRFVSNYVLDLLSSPHTSALINEAHRILAPNGLLCLVSLTHGTAWLSQCISSVWNVLYRVRPKLVGGCRPIELLDFVTKANWEMVYHTVVSAFGIPSEVVVARRRSSADTRAGYRLTAVSRDKTQEDQNEQ